jgi:hypothetical protein
MRRAQDHVAHAGGHESSTELLRDLEVWTVDREVVDLGKALPVGENQIAGIDGESTLVCRRREKTISLMAC